MAEDNKYNDDDKSSKKSEFRVPPRTWIVWIAIFGGIILLMLAKERMTPPSEKLTQYSFFQKVNSNLIAKATINYSAQSAFLTEVVGTYYERDAEGNKLKEVPFRTSVRLVPELETMLVKLLSVRSLMTTAASVAAECLSTLLIASCTMR